MKLTEITLAIGLAVVSVSPAVASFEAGQAALKRNDAITAVDEWITVAKRGDARAQFALGQLLEAGGDGVVADPVDALSWYRLAAAQGLAEAEPAAERLSGELGAAAVEEAQLRTLATVGVWFRNYTGQDEAAYQQMRAVAAAERQSTPRVEIGTSDTLAEQRAAAQRELLAQRKAEEEANARALEESREAAIRAAQIEAEEAKRQQSLREQQIAAQRQAIAARDAAPAGDELAAARARLAALMAKQDAASGTAAAATAETAPAVPAAPAAIGTVQQNAIEAPARPAEAADTPSETPTPAPLRTDAAPESASRNAPEATVRPVTPKETVVAAAPAMNSAKMNAAGSSVATVTDEKAASLAALKEHDGLNRDIVEQIFEQAKIADLGTPAARQEIENSLSRIEALKWSLVSGAKGDKAAPKMNKVLMSSMTPVQIAEASRLAREYLIKQYNL